MKQILFLTLLAVLFTACQDQNSKETNQQYKSVFATKALPQNREQKRVISTTATSDMQARLSFKVKGSVVYLKAEVGDFIKKDQLIAKLDAEPYKTKKQQLQYALKEAEAKLYNAQNSYKRVKKLYVNDHASGSDFDSAKAAFQSAEAKVENIKKQLEYANLHLSYTKLHAPHDGYISRKFVEEDENVDAGTPIVFLSQTLIDEVQVQIPQNLINRIKPNQKAEVFFDDLAKNSFDAKVQNISKFADAESKTYMVTLKLTNPPKSLKAGMSGKVHFDFAKKREIFYLPARSVLKDKKGHFVYLLEPKKKHYVVKKQYVEVGKLSSKGFEIVSGLPKDALVVKAGMSEVFEDMKVQIVNTDELGL